VVENQLKAARLTVPSFTFDPPEILNDKAFTQEIVLNAGDVFYFPAGMWHKVESLETGVSMNVSLISSSWADLTANAIRHVLYKQPISSSAICRNAPLHRSCSKAESLLETPTDELDASIMKKKKKSSSSSSSLSSSSSSSSNTKYDVRSTAQAVLLELKSVVNALQVEDILPFVLSHPLEDTMVQDEGEEVEEEEDQEEDEEDQGQEDDDGAEEEEEEESFNLMNIPIMPMIKETLTLPLRVNPLAELFQERELTDYYDSIKKIKNKTEVRKDDQDDDKEVKFMWLLNVNYGNDGLQSVFRKRLYVDSEVHNQQLLKLVTLIKTEEEKKNNTATQQPVGNKNKDGGGMLIDVMFQQLISPEDDLKSCSSKSSKNKAKADDRMGSLFSRKEFDQMVGALVYFGFLSPSIR
jgi:hypothetical protein